LRQLGLSLAEVIVSIALLGVIVVSTVLLFLSLQRSSNKTTDSSAALTYAQAVLDQAVAEGPPDWGGPGGSRDLYTHDAVTRTTFTHELAAQLVYSPSSTALPMGDLYRLDVTVYWWSDAPDQTRQGMGKLSTKLGRLVFVEQ